MKRVLKLQPLHEYEDEDYLGIYTLYKGNRVIAHFMALNLKNAKDQLAASHLGEEYGIKSAYHHANKYSIASEEKLVYPSLKKLIDNEV